VKDIATTAADAASYALKKEKPPLKADDSAALYVPLAAEGLVAAPLMPPIAGTARRRKKSATKRTAGKASRRKPAAKATKKAAKKSRVRKSGASGRSRRVPAKATSAAATKKRAAKKTARKVRKTSRKR
jgi:hypothetical protein